MRLIEGAGGLIEGMRPGAMERLGLGPAECAARNGRLVYGRMTGWGQAGPLSQVAGHDNNYAALSGALYFNGTAAEPPTSALSLLADVGGGALYLAIGMLAGLVQARSSGKGSVVDASMVDGSAHMLQLLLGSKLKGHTTNERSGNMHDSSHFFATYRCADGEFVTVGAIEPQFYKLLVEKLEFSEKSGLDDQWNRSRWPELKVRFASVFATRTQAEWVSRLEALDVCFAPVLSPRDAALHPHNVFRKIYFSNEGLLQTTPAPRFDDVVTTPGPIPQLGEHTDAVLGSIAVGGIDAVWRAARTNASK